MVRDEFEEVGLLVFGCRVDVYAEVSVCVESKDADRLRVIWHVLGQFGALGALSEGVGLLVRLSYPFAGMVRLVSQLLNDLASLAELTVPFGGAQTLLEQVTSQRHAVSGKTTVKVKSLPGCVVCLDHSLTSYVLYYEGRVKLVRQSLLELLSFLLF